jgi:low temperature requirement protein LtrA
MDATVAKRVGYLELFFDLVFVFAVTQLVSFLEQDHSPAGWGRAAVLLWLVWWAWSQLAWAGNAIDLDRRRIRLGVLAITGAMLAAAAVLPDAFGDGDAGPRFAVPYATVRLVGLGLYWAGLRGDHAHRAALQTYVPVQLASPLLMVTGGFTTPGWRTALWITAIGVDVVSAAAAGRGEFRIDPGHFAERHGLIIIIALGESIVAIGATASGIGLDTTVGLLLAPAFVAVAGLWWCYFDWVHAAAERRLAGEADHRRRSNLARDLFTFGHLPIVAGTVVFAAAIEEALRHPTERLGSFGITALAAGPALYLAGFVAGNLRATGRLLVDRALGLLAVVGVALAAGTAATATVAIAAVAAVIVAIAAFETVRRP